MKIVLSILLLFSLFVSHAQEDHVGQDQQEQEQQEQEQRQRKERNEAFKQIQRQVDSLDRPRLKDSLGIDDAKASALFAIRTKFSQQSDSIYSDPYQDFPSKQEQIRQLRQETDQAYQTLLGKALYRRYIEMITGQSKQRRRGKWDKNILPLTLEPI